MEYAGLIWKNADKWNLHFYQTEFDKHINGFPYKITLMIDLSNMYMFHCSPNYKKGKDLYVMYFFRDNLLTNELISAVYEFNSTKELQDAIMNYQKA